MSAGHPTLARGQGQMYSGISDRSSFKCWHHTHFLFQPLLEVTVPCQKSESMSERHGTAAEILYWECYLLVLPFLWVCSVCSSEMKIMC